MNCTSTYDIKQKHLGLWRTFIHLFVRPFTRQRTVACATRAGYKWNQTRSWFQLKGPAALENLGVWQGGLQRGNWNFFKAIGSSCDLCTSMACELHFFFSLHIFSSVFIPVALDSAGEWPWSWRVERVLVDMPAGRAREAGQWEQSSGGFEEEEGEWENPPDFPRPWDVVASLLQWVQI